MHSWLGGCSVAATTLSGHHEHDHQRAAQHDYATQDRKDGEEFPTSGWPVVNLSGRIGGRCGRRVGCLLLGRFGGRGAGGDGDRFDGVLVLVADRVPVAGHDPPPHRVHARLTDGAAERHHARRRVHRVADERDVFRPRRWADALGDGQRLVKPVARQRA